jgi:protein TonB
MHAIRGPFAVVAGVAASGALFLVLGQLISVPFEAAPVIEGRKVDYTAKRPDTPAVTKREEKVTLEPPTAVPKGPPLIVDDPGGERIQPVVYRRPELTRVGERGGFDVRGADGDVLPRIRVNPEYPPRALAASIEGWVQVRFTVTAIGTVRDAVVVASEPGTVFDDAALKSIARWRYNPRVENGEAVERVGLQTLVRFELEE